MNIHIQPEYCGRELNAIVLHANMHDDIQIVNGTGDKENLHVGSVEFVESVIGKQTPDFYPDWAKDHLHREIRAVSGFFKSATGYKTMPAFTDTMWVSEEVIFTNEWRHYIADGVDLCSWWYDGSEITCDEDPHGPPLPFDVPDDFCGAVDIGRLFTGELALVEVHHPFAIGWYGEQAEAEKYFTFLLQGWKKGLR